MPRKTVTNDPSKRRKTRHPGVTYRIKADGTRSYFVYASDKQHLVQGGEKDALALQAELRNRPKGTIVRSNVRFSEIAEEWYASKHRLRRSTLRCHRTALDNEVLPVFGQRRIASISPHDIARLIQTLEARGLASSTIKRYLVPLSGTLGMAASRGLIPHNPYTLLTIDERPAKTVKRTQSHIWNDEEIRGLINAAEHRAAACQSQYDYSPLIRFAIFTGLRLGEVLGLQWADVDLDANELYVRRQWTKHGEITPPKSAASVRRLPLPDDLVTFLREHHKHALATGTGSIYVFPSKTGGPLCHRNVQRRGFEPAAKLAKIEGVSFNSLRHAFASRMIFRGISADLLARLMGHESSVITQRYVHLFDKVRTDEAVRLAMSH